MLKCITFDGDTSTLNTLMGYFEKLDKALADVHQVLSKEQTERPIFVREGSKIIRLRREEILFLSAEYFYRNHPFDRNCLFMLSSKEDKSGK